MADLTDITEISVFAEFVWEKWHTKVCYRVLQKQAGNADGIFPIKLLLNLQEFCAESRFTNSDWVLGVFQTILK